MLAGDNSDRPRLIFASEPKAIRIGDRVVTSGEGGVFPPGLPVGVVASLDPDGARIAPYAELSQLDYVLLVDYGLAGGLPQPAPAGTGQKRPGKPPDAGRQEDALSGGAEPVRPAVLAAGSQRPRGFLPTATIVAAAVLALLPLPVPGYAALTPSFALMAVYHWSVYRPDLLPSSGLFAIGFAQDLLSGATIPASALLLLLARAAVLRYRRHFVGRPFPFVWAGFRGARSRRDARIMGAALRNAARPVRSADRDRSRRGNRCAVPGGEPDPGSQSARADRRRRMTRLRRVRRRAA